MANQKKVFTKQQDIYSEPRMILVETYTTKSGQQKNRYKVNPNAKVIKTITHPIIHRRIK